MPQTKTHSLPRTEANLAKDLGVNVPFRCSFLKCTVSFACLFQNAHEWRPRNSIASESHKSFTLAAWRLPWGLLSGSDVTLPINSRLGDSQAQKRKSTIPRMGEKEAEGNPRDAQNSSKLWKKNRFNHCRPYPIPPCRPPPEHHGKSACWLSCSNPRGGKTGLSTFLLSLQHLFQFFQYCMAVQLAGLRAGLLNDWALASYFTCVPHFHHLYKGIDKEYLCHVFIMIIKNKIA